MKKILMIAMCATIFCGCGEKHIISVDRIEAMSKINVLYVAIAEIYELGLEDGSTSLSRLVRGGAYYSIDLSKIKASTTKVEEGGRVEISLPSPSVEPKPDPGRSKELAPKVKFLYTDAGLNKIREEYDAYDRKKITAAANKPEYMKMAKMQAEEVLRSMLPELKVTIKWKE